jgi:hypothetical protein
MTAEEILQSLEQLESNLQNIESARTQVETTVNAFAEVHKTFNEVGTNIALFNETLSALIDTVKTNSSNLSADARAILLETIELQQKASKQFADDTSKLADTLLQSCENAGEAVKEKTNVSIDRLDVVIKTLKADCESVITLLRSNVDSFVNQMNVYQTKQDKLFADLNVVIKALQETQTSNFANVIQSAKDLELKINKSNESISSLATSISNLESNIINAINTLNKEILGCLDKSKTDLATSITASQTALSTLISDKNDELSNLLSLDFKELSDLITAAKGEIVTLLSGSISNNIKSVDSKVDNLAKAFNSNANSTSSSLTKIYDELQANSKEVKSVKLLTIISFAVNVILLIVLIILKFI